jgi:phospholipase C
MRHSIWILNARKTLPCWMVTILNNRSSLISRRSFLGRSAGSLGAAIASNALLQPLQKALAIEAFNKSGTISDVEHVVILMQENRSFDHYFGSFRGVRGFGDRHPVPLATGKPIWYQPDGEHVIAPFHLDTKVSNALKTPPTPHTYDNAQAAWNQGRFGLWPKFKTPMSMGYYRRSDIPFQFALAEAFTICDAHHCSVTTGTDPNRVMFWSGSNHDPQARTRGEDCTADNAEVNNLRCMVTGTFPDPGYSYQGSALNWPTIPDALEKAGVSWQIYQDANDNWNGLMHGGLAFESFRSARGGSALYEHGMASRTLDQLETNVEEGRLPAVSWILPPMSDSAC